MATGQNLFTSDKARTLVEPYCVIDENHVMTFKGRLNGSIYSTATAPSGYLIFQYDQSTTSGYINLRHHNSLRVGTSVNDNDIDTRWTKIFIGNDIASGTVGNSQGWLCLYGSDSSSTQIAKSGTGNSNYFYIPNYSGNGFAITHSSSGVLGSNVQPIFVSAEGRVSACIDYANANVLSAAYIRCTSVAAQNDCLPAADASMQVFCVSNTDTGGADGFITSWRWTSGSYITQLFCEADPTFIWSARFRNGSGNWTAWKRFVFGDGTGASGTWPISISGNAATASTAAACSGNAASASTCSSYNLTDIALTWSGSYATGDWMLIHNGETGTNGGQLFRAINSTNTAAWVDGAHKWVRLGGDTMSGTLQIINDSQNAGCDALLNIQHKSNNDWGIKVVKGNYDYGGTINCASTATHAWQVTGRITGTTVYGAVWNDYAECRNVEDTVEPGRVVYETDIKIMKKSQTRMQPGCHIVSDTYGMCIGETKDAKVPIAVCGRVLAYPYRDRNKYKLGAAVCSAPNGTIDIMTREEIRNYPERIIGVVSEIPDYDIWRAGEQDGNHDIKVNNRIWIYVR